MPAPFLIEQYWALGGYKNKEGEGIQIGPLKCAAEEGSDCLNVNGSPTGGKFDRSVVFRIDRQLSVCTYKLANKMYNLSDVLS